MKTILVPVDFSSTTSAAVETAMRLAKACGGKILLFHVISHSLDYRAYPVLDRTVLEAELSRARQELERLLPAVQAAGITVSAHTAAGEPVGLILAQAKFCRADVIVLGSRRHTAIYDLLVGSTSSGILQGSSCPVMFAPLNTCSDQEKPTVAAAS